MSGTENAVARRMSTALTPSRRPGGPGVRAAPPEQEKETMAHE
jgi:hypothetical protein